MHIRAPFLDCLICPLNLKTELLTILPIESHRTWPRALVHSELPKLIHPHSSSAMKSPGSSLGMIMGCGIALGGKYFTYKTKWGLILEFYGNFYVEKISVQICVLT